LKRIAVIGNPFRRVVLFGLALVLCVYTAIVAAAPVSVLIQTDAGDITVELDADKAPATVANFLAYVDQGLYNGAEFYRVLRLDNDRNPNSKVTYIQGGLNGKGKPLPPVAHETTTQTGIKHTDGVISMIRQAPGTATSEFFIVIGDNPPFDAGGVRLPDGQGFSAFGRTVRGMDVVRKINAGEANGPAPNPNVQGQILTRPVKILAIRRM